MVKTCCVKKCPSKYKSSKGQDKVSFHLFPRDNETILKKWMSFLNYSDKWKPSKYAVICNKHFKPTDFRCHINNHNILEPTAVPSLNPPAKILRKMKGYEDLRTKSLWDCKYIIKQSEAVAGTFIICRLCCKIYYDDIQYFNISNSEIKMNLQHLLDANIDFMNFHLPQNICLNCKCLLTDLHSFVLTIKQSQDVLKSIFSVSEDVGDEDALVVDNSDCAPNSKKFFDAETQTHILNNDIIKISLTQNSESNSIIIVDDDRGICDVTKSNSLTSSDTTVMGNKLTLCETENMSEVENKRIIIKGERINYEELTEKLPTLNPAKRIQVLQNIEVGFMPELEKPTEYPVDLSRVKQEIHETDVKPECPKNFNRSLYSHTSKTITNRNTQNQVQSKNNYCSREKALLCIDCDQHFVSKSALNHHTKNICVTKESVKVEYIEPYESVVIKKEMETANRKQLNSAKADLPEPNILQNIEFEICTSCSAQYIMGVNHICPTEKDIGRKQKSTLNKSYLCDICGISFTLQRNLQRHKVKQHPYMTTWMQSYKCYQCNMSFNKYFTYKNHTRDHTHRHYSIYKKDGKLRWVCRYCNFTAVCKHYVKCHISEEHTSLVDGGLFKNKFKYRPSCVKCGLRFKTILAFRRHIASDHKLAPIVWRNKKVCCEICNKMCLSKNSTQHMKMRHPGKIGKTNTLV